MLRLYLTAQCVFVRWGCDCVCVCVRVPVCARVCQLTKHIYDN